jgi:hypothetical protein
MYGVWIPGQGWLKAEKPNHSLEPFAHENYHVAYEVALHLGNGAEVWYIDPPLVALEQEFIRAEQFRKERWNRFLARLRGRT